MDNFFIKLMLLIIPAVISVVIIVLEPLYKEKVLRNTLIGQRIIVIITILDDHSDEDIEVYSTYGIVVKIKTDVMFVKRKNKPTFRVPFIRGLLLENASKTEFDYTYSIRIENIDDFDENFGVKTNAYSYEKLK